MAERPTTPTTAAPTRPPAVFFITALTGLAALTGAASTLTGPLRYLAIGPLLLAGAAAWVIAVIRFAQWGTALRNTRDAAAEAANAADAARLDGQTFSPRRSAGTPPSPRRSRERELAATEA